MAAHGLPEGHQEIDWSKWSPPGEGDVRSPCPALNALANHSILPHNGKGITKATAVKAITSAYNIDASIASIFAIGAIATNPDHHADFFDLDNLDKHGAIEHDGSLSRNDAAFGSDSKFDAEKWNEVVRGYEKGYQSEHSSSGGSSGTTVDWNTASHVRYARIAESRDLHEKANKQFSYGLKEAITSYGESALFINVLGKGGVASLDWIKIFFEQERLPYDEGWRTPSEKITQGTLSHAYLKMIEANEHRSEEARWVGVGTFEALKESILSLGAGLIKMPSRKD